MPFAIWRYKHVRLIIEQESGNWNDNEVAARKSLRKVNCKISHAGVPPFINDRIEGERKAFILLGLMRRQDRMNEVNYCHFVCGINGAG
ncbi:hypothetical protein BJD12_03500 [Xanthomonas vesicatoria ATCC 35937]|uniref:Uncharacterized protein n=1 Tax=Xanthomonas vesicatoria ATCC 35937 TaxID=925775 RepID=F0BEW4_9XANT|nr:hypothetical protein BJD12_03500 [Xanthomonas vesicatoria ATCC 35937]EGD08984.1 hypothetical protein XVE_2744 [Xanthomonas vesicatoria ATCC 35937]KTF32525.1 hypothetical protein LMG920_12710 [Xanthomonas vesicatoria]KTF38238.1 hypothetical protein LMG919_03700 [Xanthomonas vesicatoria]